MSQEYNWQPGPLMITENQHIVQEIIKRLWNRSAVSFSQDTAIPSIPSKIQDLKKRIRNWKNYETKIK